MIGGLVQSDDARVTSVRLAPYVPLPPMDFMLIRGHGPAQPYEVYHLPAGTPPFELPATW